MSDILVRHFLDLDLMTSNVLRQIIDDAKKIKSEHFLGRSKKTLSGKNLVCIFEKPSTRTRVSFQIGMQQLGGSVTVLDDVNSHMGQGESIADTARVLSRYADAIMFRTDDPKKLQELAQHSSIPVINGLTDFSHPCQIMADILTFEEHRGSIFGKTIAWSGDGNNVLTSWLHAAVHFGFEVKVGCPGDCQPDPRVVKWGLDNGAVIKIFDTAVDAVRNADLVITDTWVSMGDEDVSNRRDRLSLFKVDSRLMSLAAKDALFMHCLPAHRGEEVTDEVMDGPQSVIWDEAENRLHAQKSILAWCLD
uniref:Ornithine carbamoyltransferase n=1 Tax=uncultured nuHF1 cluster bacterium HF0770_35I22 TaxID=723586 RepID=E7C7M7_9BACT|nr:ornithine carbamoyltransferase [uncultured nuHF1 cluster bacterium HF0770_35I22]